MKLNTVIRVTDGRLGTICYHNLDGTGGVWGEHTFTMPPNSGFGDELPPPDFMFRGEDMRESFRRDGHKETLELLGDHPNYKIVRVPG